MTVSGLLLADKPRGISSNHLLGKIKRLYGIKKAGHGGTLDPLATGLIPIFLGSATRFSNYSLASEKGYESTFALGRTSETLDEGSQVSEEKVFNGTWDEVKTEVENFIHLSEQLAPTYSALKQDGQPMYKLAREGKKVNRKRRTIAIRSSKLLSTEKDLPLVKVQIICSKGTYIRSLAETLGVQLNTVGMVSSLRRISIGDWHIDQALTLPELEQMSMEDRLAALSQPQDFLTQLPTIALSSSQAKDILQGRLLNVDIEQLNNIDDKEILVSVSALNIGFLGICHYFKDKKILKSVRLIETEALLEIIKESSSSKE